MPREAVQRGHHEQEQEKVERREVSQDGSAVNDEITSSDEPSSDGLEHSQHKQ